MRKKRLKGFAALAAVAALGLSACGGNGGSDDGGSAAGSEKFNAALGSVYHPSDKKGGILKLGQAGDWADSVDPGNTYYGYSWDFLRTYARSLVMFKPAAGKASERAGPRPRRGPGQGQRRRQDLDLHDPQGRQVRGRQGGDRGGRQVRRRALLRQDGARPRPGVLRRDARLAGRLQGCVQVARRQHRLGHRDARQVHDRVPPEGPVRRVRLPRAAAADGAGAEGVKDTGAKYKEHVISSGPYKWKTYSPGKKYELERNPEWDQSTDPNRKALPDGYEITLEHEPGRRGQPGHRR